MVNFHFPKVEIGFPIFLLPKLKVSNLSINSLQYTNVHLCAKFGDLKPTIDEKSSHLNLFLSKANKQHSTRKMQFSFDQLFHIC